MVVARPLPPFPRYCPSLTLHTCLHTTGVIYVESSLLTVEHCSFIANKGPAAAAIDAYRSFLSLRHTSFEDCYSESYGGAVQIGAGTLLGSNLTFTRCTAEFLGGAISSEFTRIDLTSATFIDCSVKKTQCDPCRHTKASRSLNLNPLPCCVWCVTHAQTQVVSDTESGGGAISMIGDEIVKLTRATFRGCTAVTRGGAIYGDSTAALVMSWSSVVGCSARLGGALAFAQRATVHVSWTWLLGNVAAVSGGALHCDKCWEYQLIHCAFDDNQAGTFGGAVFLHAILAKHGYVCVPVQPEWYPHKN